MEAGRRRVVVWAVCASLVTLPFFVVRFPPITDLPQHVAQVRLLLDTVGNPNSPYRVQWFTPYSLVYGVLGAAWALFRPEAVGRAGIIVIGLLWTGATHLLAWKRQRAASAAILASVLFFSPILYWGFFSFAIGWPAFGLWFLLTTRSAALRFRWLDAISLLSGAMLLYFSHALWFAAGVAWLVGSSLVFRVPLRIAALRVASISPVVVAAAIWYPHLSAGGFTSPPLWLSTPTGHLSASWLVDAAFGGLRGATEYAVFAALIGWLFLSVWQHRDTLWSLVDRELLLAGTMFLSAALLLPYKYMNTIQFAERWLPAALILLLLALPAPILKPVVLRSVALAVLGVFCLSTTMAWVRFDRNEVDGLQETLDALPATPRVIGLDFMKESAIVAHRPFLQLFAYAQVMHGGTLNFSFADFAPSLVVFRKPRRLHWTPHLEWDAERVVPGDFSHFDYAIIGGGPKVQATYAALPQLTAVTRTGHWRLYRVTEGAS